jgi:ribonuclease E
MFRSCCSAQIVAAALAAATLSSCGSIALFDQYDIPESPEVAAAPWPKLIDTPPAPPVGTYTAAVPDPAEGVATQADLGAAGAAANARAAALAAPVVAPVDAPVAAPVVAKQGADRGEAAPVQGGATPAESALAAAAAARAAALAAPVIPDAERAAMLEAARRSPPAPD